MRKQADELVLTMNRAAEAAVPEAKQLLVDAVKKMSVQDAKGILTGGDTAATEYFKRTTEGDLGQRFLPIVKKATEKVGLAHSTTRSPARAPRSVKETRRRSRATSRRRRSTACLMIGEQEKAFGRIRRGVERYREEGLRCARVGGDSLPILVARTDLENSAGRSASRTMLKRSTTGDCSGHRQFQCA